MLFTRQRYRRRLLDDIVAGSWRAAEEAQRRTAQAPERAAL
jgi:hypothetical protein